MVSIMHCYGEVPALPQHLVRFRSVCHVKQIRHSSHQGPADVARHVIQRTLDPRFLR